MKKILAAILFFGSVGTAMAAGAIDQYWNPDMPRQVCKYRKEKRWVPKSPKDFSCETPAVNGPSHVPNPSRDMVRAHSQFEADHNNGVEITVLESNALAGLVFPADSTRKRLTGPNSGGMGCSIFGTIAEREPAKAGAAQAACNSARLIAVDRHESFSMASGVFANVTSAFGAFWTAVFGGVPAQAPAGSRGGSSVRASASASVQGCFWSEVLEEGEVSVPYDCVTVAPSCEMTQMKISRAEMVIREAEMVVARIKAIATNDDFTEKMKQAMLERAQAELIRARKELVGAKRECMEPCKLGGGAPMDGSSSDEEVKPVTCTRIQEKRQIRAE